MTDTKYQDILTDSFCRKHTYLRISITERCNLRCSYCMPINGVPLTPKAHLMTAKEIGELASIFVKYGVNKIRLTGGEPLLRKDISEILKNLHRLNIPISITSNAIIIDRYINILKQYKVKHINVSLDTLSEEKNIQITHRNFFERIYSNIHLLIKNNFKVKINVVLMKGVNENEIIDFVELTKTNPISIRFIEFMPFSGNQWNKNKLVSLQEILDRINNFYPEETIIRLKDSPNDTTKNYMIKNYIGSFGIISSITNPFCDSCNRLRLTADGKLKNCLFSASESDLLTTMRNGGDITPIIKKVIQEKYKTRGGMDSQEKIENPNLHKKNRSMTIIGG